MITHGKPQTIGPALERLEKVASEAGVELLLPDEEVEKHGVGEPEDDLSDADIAVVLGGDGTMLRALQRFLGTGIPVVGVNFGRVGFLASIQPNELESGLARVFSGDYRVVQLATLEVEVDGLRGAAINDVVVLSSIKGRMVELAWALGGEDMAVQPCDGMICPSPSPPLRPVPAARSAVQLPPARARSWVTGSAARKRWARLGERLAATSRTMVEAPLNASRAPPSSPVAWIWRSGTRPWTWT